MAFRCLPEDLGADSSSGTSDRFFSNHYLQNSSLRRMAGYVSFKIIFPQKRFSDEPYRHILNGQLNQKMVNENKLSLNCQSLTIQRFSTIRWKSLKKKLKLFFSLQNAQVPSPAPNGRVPSPAPPDVPQLTYLSSASALPASQSTAGD